MNISLISRYYHYYYCCCYYYYCLVLKGILLSVQSGLKFAILCTNLQGTEVTGVHHCAQFVMSKF